MTAPSDELLRKLFARLQEIKTENERLKQGLNDEPIAIIGVGCRLPSGVSSLRDFGDRLASGFNWLTHLPDERAFFQSKAEAHWRSSLVDDVEQFDPAFFGLTTAEAAEIDPQQRILLEVTYHALEDARYPASQLRGQDVGVFIGSSTDDYQNHAMSAQDDRRLNALNVLGTGRSLAAGRIAYHFDFAGPVLQIDTACSSSLMAIHLACNSLRQREARLALAGGVALNLRPEGYVVRDAVGKLSRSGTCQAFSEDADGFARGEGCGLVLLKRLADALEDGDHIHTVIYASVANHNGRSNGMTAPNGEAQRRLMRHALEKAGLRAGDIDFVEPHGTASRLGDSIEAHSIGEALAGQRESPLWLGSLKSRLGHLEAAAGVTSVLRTCAMLAAETLFPDAPIGRPNQLIRWDRHAVRTLEEPVRWPRRTGHPRRAGINAFGLNGTNVHLILGDPPEIYHRSWSHDGALPTLLCVSGKTRTSYLKNLRAALKELRESSQLQAMALGSCLHKEHFRYRRSFVADHPGPVIDAMVQAEREGQEPKAAEPLAFCFDGGAWSLPALRELYQAVGPFRQAVDECVSACAGHAVDITWLETAQGEPWRSALGLIGEYATAKTWLALGVRPAAAAARGRGVQSAAAVAGLISPACMCGVEQDPLGVVAALDGAQPEFPVLFVATDGVSSLADFAPTQIAALAGNAQRWPSSDALPVKRLLWLSSGANGLITSDAGLGAGSELARGECSARALIATVGELYDLGFDLRFEHLYDAPRARLEAALPAYRFDTSALWTARQPTGGCLPPVGASASSCDD